MMSTDANDLIVALANLLLWRTCMYVNRHFRKCHYIIYEQLNDMINDTIYATRSIFDMIT
jgi:hypothetical protein